MRIKYDLTGKQIGSWKVLKRMESVRGKTGKLQQRWLCECKCGRVKTHLQSNLLRKHTKQCTDCYMEEITLPGLGEITGRYWNSLIRGAKNRSLVFEINLKYAWGLFIQQEGKCNLSGVELEFGKNGTASLDRIDSSKGYIAGNVQWVHKKINRIKNVFQDEVFIGICHSVSSHQTKCKNEADKVIPTLQKYILVDGFDLVLDFKRSYGSYIVDARNNKKYLDCFGQFGSQALGWNHIELVSKIDKLSEISLTKIAHSDIYVKHYATFLEKLAETMPEFSKFFFISSGALAVENALKIAFDWKVQKLGIEDNENAINNLNIIHFENAFHGRSSYCLNLTNTDPIKTKWFPKFKWPRFPVSDIGLEMLEKTLQKNNSAAVIIEPIICEGGDIHVDKEFLVSLREITNKNECLLIFDEVQTGLSTGKYWCYQHFGVASDLLAFGKKMQVCGVAGGNRIFEVPTNAFNVSSRINSTWGADGIDLARSAIILDTIKKYNLLDQSKLVGDYFVDKLKSLDLINARGRGSIIAFDMPTKEERDMLLNKLCEKMLCLPCGSKSIRFRPHLTFTEEDVDQATDIISNAIA